MCMFGGLAFVPTILVVTSPSFVLLTISITKNMQIQYLKSSSLTHGLNDTSRATLLQAESSLKEVERTAKGFSVEFLLSKDDSFSLQGVERAAEEFPDQSLLLKEDTISLPKVA